MRPVSNDSSKLPSRRLAPELYGGVSSRPPENDLRGVHETQRVIQHVPICSCQSKRRDYIANLTNLPTRKQQLPQRPQIHRCYKQNHDSKCAGCYQPWPVAVAVKRARRGKRLDVACGRNHASFAAQRALAWDANGCCPHHARIKPATKHAFARVWAAWAAGHPRRRHAVGRNVMRHRHLQPARAGAAWGAETVILWCARSLALFRRGLGPAPDWGGGRRPQSLFAEDTVHSSPQLVAFRHQPQPPPMHAPQQGVRWHPCCPVKHAQRLGYRKSTILLCPLCKALLLSTRERATTPHIDNTVGTLVNT